MARNNNSLIFYYSIEQQGAHQKSQIKKKCFLGSLHLCLNIGTNNKWLLNLMLSNKSKKDPSFSVKTEL